MYDGAGNRLAARIAAKSDTDESGMTMPYRFGLPALLVHRLSTK